MAWKLYDFQLKSLNNGRAIIQSGGMAMVVAAGDTTKVALQDQNGNAISNPVALVNGRVTFRTATSVPSVDVYIMCPTGHFLVLKGMTPGDRQEVGYDIQNPYDEYTIPYAASDYTAAAEGSTGMQLLKDVMIEPIGSGVLVTTLEASKTLNAGILSSETGGSATGFLNAISVAAAGMIPAKSAATATRGSFIGAGTLDTPYRCDGVAKTISLTTSAGSAAQKGFIILPAIIPPTLLPNS